MSGKNYSLPMAHIVVDMPMTTSVTHFPSRPTRRDPIDPYTLAYMRQRNKGRAYSAVISEFEKSGISQADLAGRLHKGTDQISRWLGSPGNWTLDTVSDLFFAISGGEPTYGVEHPLDLPATNQITPNWMTPVTYRVEFGNSVSGVNTVFLADGSNASVVSGGGTYLETNYGPNLTSLTANAGSNLNTQCVNCYNFGANVTDDDAVLSGSSWLAHSHNEYFSLPIGSSVR